MKKIPCHCLVQICLEPRRKVPSPTTSKYMDTSIHPLSLCIDIDKSPIWEALDDSANEQAMDGTQEQDQDPPPAMGVEDVDGEHVPIVLPRLLCKRDSKGMDAPRNEETHHQEPIVYSSHKRPYPVEVRASESDIERADDACRVCGAPASNGSIYPDIAGYLCDTCLNAEITAADPNYINAVESMPLSVALDFSAKAKAKAAAIHQRTAAKAHRHNPPGPNMGIQGFAFPTVTPTYNGARYRWLMQGWESEFLANAYYF